MRHGPAYKVTVDPSDGGGHVYLIARLPNARSISSPSRVGDIAGACISEVPWLSSRSCAGALPRAFVGSRIFSSRSSQPGATLRFSASSRSLIPCSHSSITCLESCSALAMCCCKALHDLTMSSGCAVCPLAEVMYLGLSEFGSSIIEGGREGGIWRKLYGRVTAEGRDRKGETVSGTWARRGCSSDLGQKGSALL